MNKKKSKMCQVNGENQTLNGRTCEEFGEVNFIEQETGDDCENESEADRVTWRDIRKQILAINVGYLFTANDGMTFAFSNLILDELDSDTGSWFASIVGLSIPIGSLLSGPLMDRYGRRTTNLILAIPCIPAWFITSFLNLNCSLWLYTTRCLVGLAMGLATSNIVYASEVCHKLYRPLFLSLCTLYFSLGILIVSTLQIFMTWRQVAFFNGVYFIVALLLNKYATPETPIWLAHFRGDWAEAKRSLKWLNPNPEVFEAEWKELTNTMKYPSETNHKATLKITSPAIYKPLCILLILFTLQEGSFVYVLIVYTVKILSLVSPQLGDSMKDKAFAFLGVLRFLANILGCILSLKVGRRPLMQISSLGVATASLLLIILPYCIDDTIRSIPAGVYEWTMVVLSFMIIAFATLGIMTVPWCLMVELLPHEARSQGSAVMICYSYSLLFILAKIFPYLLETLGTDLVFTFITAVSLLTSLFVFFFVPETLGKSFAEIEKYFHK